MGITFALLSRYQSEYYKQIAWKTAGIFALLFLLFVGSYGMSLHVSYMRPQIIDFTAKDLKEQMNQMESFSQFSDAITVWQYAWVSISVCIFSFFRRWVLRRHENYSYTLMVFVIILLSLSLLGFTAGISNITSVYEGGTYWSSFNWAHYALFAGIIGTLAAVRSYEKQENWTKALGLLLILWMLSLEMVQWSFVSGFGAGYKILLSVLWVSFAVAMIIIGIKRRQAVMRITAMVILGITILKMFFYDLSSLSTIYKTVAIIAIGGLFLVGAYFYQTLSKQNEPEADQPQPIATVQENEPEADDPSRQVRDENA
jgi:hypothetical protein